MEETNDTPSQLNRFQVDGMHNINIVEWRKRKLQSDQLDLLRPKRKCWDGHASLFDENPVLESMHNHTVKSITDTSVVDDRSEPESVKDSNSFIEDCDTAMSVNEEAKAEADCANTYLYDMQALENPEEHLLGAGSFSGHPYSEHADDSSEHSVDKEFEDFLFSNGVNPNTYVLSSGRWNVDQEAQSSTRPPTIDQEFEQYFSMLML